MQAIIATDVLATFHVGGDLADPDMDRLLESIMGPMVIPKDTHDPEILAAIKVPCGSSGPLQWDIALEPYNTQYYCGVVTVWGSLRDCSSSIIFEWFKNTLYELCVHGLVFNAVCSVTLKSDKPPVRGIVFNAVCSSSGNNTHPMIVKSPWTDDAEDASAS